MPIVPSRTRDIQKLVEQLGAESGAARQSAVARLTLLGDRALRPVLAALRSPRALVRREALSVLEGLREPRALPEVLALLRDPDGEVARRAMEAAAAWPGPRSAEALGEALALSPPALRLAAVSALGRIHAAGVVEALDPLLAVVLDERDQDDVRLAALEALSRLSEEELRPLLARLRDSASPSVAARTRQLEALSGRGRFAAPDDAEALVEALLRSPGRADLALRAAKALRRLGPRGAGTAERALERTDSLLPLRTLAEALGNVGSATSIPPLRRALQRLSARARDGADAAAVAEAKAVVHGALAALGSRIALYDLREMLEARPVLAPRALLDATARIGDGTVVPALAALAADEPSLLAPCARVFAAIVQRERLRRGSRALKAVRQAHRAALDALWARARRAR